MPRYYERNDPPTYLFNVTSAQLQNNPESNFTHEIKASYLQDLEAKCSLSFKSFLFSRHLYFCHRSGALWWGPSPPDSGRQFQALLQIKKHWKYWSGPPRNNWWGLSSAPSSYPTCENECRACVLLCCNADYEEVMGLCGLHIVSDRYRTMYPWVAFVFVMVTFQSFFTLKSNLNVLFLHLCILCIHLRMSCVFLVQHFRMKERQGNASALWCPPSLC